MYIKEKCYCSRCLNQIEPASICRFCGFDADTYKESGHTLPLYSILNGRYQVGCVIGSGGFGITYTGWDLSLNKPVAVKEFFPRNRVSRNTEETFSVTPTGNEDDQLIYYKGVDWFQREARILAALNDTPNIVHVEDYFRENGTAYIVMDFIRGKSLSLYAEEKGGRLRAEEVLALMKKPIEALQKVHMFGLIHRDISPDNLILAENGEVFLIDFGAATALDENSELKATELFMNHSFSPPEKDSEKDQGTWTDIYSICATVIRLMTGGNIPSPGEREQNDTVAAILKPLDLKRRQKNAIFHGLHLKIRLRTENTAVLLNELYNEPLPKTELEKNRQKQLTRYLIIGFVTSYVLLFAGLALHLERQIPMYLNAWFHNDVSQAMVLADRYARGYYLGGSSLANYWFHWVGSNGDNERKCEVAEKYQENEYEYLETDFEYAKQLLDEAGEDGYAGAYNRLGWMYWFGEFVEERSIDTAVQYFESASKSGNTLAMTNLALLYIEEFNDFEKAFALLSDASEKGDFTAMYYLAIMYDNGDWVEEDLTKALSLMLKAAEGGQPDAMAAIGYYYLCNDLVLENGSKWRDVGTGLYWLSEAGFAGCAAAKYYWGLIYKGDIDISDSIEAEGLYKQDPQKSFSQMLEAAESGYLPAMSEVSDMYETGYGTAVDLDAAEEWLHKAENTSASK